MEALEDEVVEAQEDEGVEAREDPGGVAGVKADAADSAGEVVEEVEGQETTVDPADHHREPSTGIVTFVASGDTRRSTALTTLGTSGEVRQGETVATPTTKGGGTKVKLYRYPSRGRG